MFNIKKVKKKRLNKKRTLVFIIIIYIVLYSLYCLLNNPIKHIEITGNNLVTDAEILRISKLKDYPNILKYSNRSIRKRIKKLELIEEVKVKKWFGYQIFIEVKENKPLFYYKDKLVLSNRNILSNDYKILGIPIFINELTSDELSKFVNSFKKLNDNIIYEINCIEYYPLITEKGKIINSDRYKIVMNDGNTIIANIKSISVLNKYNDIYASLNGNLGTINLDSNKLNNLVFIPYDEETPSDQ